MINYQFLEPLLKALSLGFLVYLGFLDFKYKEVDIRLLLISVILSLIYALSAHSLTDILLSFFTGGILPFLFVVASREKWMGWGDVFLAVSAGMVSGYPAVILMLVLAFIAGSIYGIINLVRSKSHIIPFGPFLVLGAMVSSLFGNSIILFYLSGGVF